MLFSTHRLQYLLPFAALLLLAQSTAPAPLTFDDNGAKVGEQLPDFTLRSLDDEPLHLHDKTPPNGVPTLIVTSSFTCPKSRSNEPALEALAAKYKDQLHIVILYVIEAHPSGDPSPYRNGKEDVTPENQRDGILRRQPTTMEKRLILANDFKNRLATKLPIAVDTMDNWAWKSVGAGPNMALLINDNRVVLARQGWFDAAALAPLIDKAIVDMRTGLDHPDGYLKSSDEALYKSLQDQKIVDYSTDQILNDKAAPSLSALLKKYPALLSFVSGHEARGDSGGETLLQSAAANNYLPPAKILLNGGADPDQATPWRLSPIDLAAEHGNTEILKLLLAKSKHPGDRIAALHAALINDHPGAADLLTAAGTRDTFYSHIARGHSDAVRAALADDVSLAGRPWSGDSPLAFAAATGQTAMVKLIAGVQPGLGTLSQDEEPVIAAIDHKHPQTLAALLDIGLSPDTSGYSDIEGSALHHAVFSGDATMVGLLLKAHALPNPPNMSGETPLHIAAALGDVASITALLNAGADINAKSGEENYPCGPPAPSAKEQTPLQLAARSGHADAVQILLAHHPDLTAEDVAGHSAIDYAGSDPIIKLLLSAGVKPGSQKPHAPKRSDPHDPN